MKIKEKLFLVCITADYEYKSVSNKVKNIFKVSFFEIFLSNLVLRNSLSKMWGWSMIRFCNENHSDWKTLQLNTAWFNFTTQCCRTNGLFELPIWKLQKYLITYKIVFYLAGQSRILVNTNTDFAGEIVKTVALIPDILCFMLTFFFAGLVFP
jgi:hypothetical protein